MKDCRNFRIMASLGLSLMLVTVACDQADSPVATEETSDRAEGSLSLSDGDGEGSGNGTGGDPQIPPGQLTAGEWRDLDNWDYWLSLVGQNEDWKQHQSEWGLYTSARYKVKVLQNNAPANDVRVLLKDKSGATVFGTRTDVEGIAELFSDVTDVDEKPMTVVVETNNGTVTKDNVSPTQEDPLVISINAYDAPENILDLMFVIDATGSMGDEMEYLKVELDDVIQRVNDADQQLSIRLSSNYYRDEGDTYVVRSFPFSTHIPEVLGQLADQRASGGGDYEEAVEQALQDALDNHQWSSSARIRLLFLVLDAPPHSTQAIIAKMQNIVKKAAEMGVRIIPVASSGVNKGTEFLLRALEILTGGTYVFLTDDSGIGGEHLEPTVGEYQVEFFNDLLVRIIKRYSSPNFSS